MQCWSTFFHSIIIINLFIHENWFQIRAASWQNQQNDCAPAKTQIRLGICPVWSESSLCAQWVAKDPSFLHADSEDSDQTGRMPSAFAGHTTILLVLSWGGSYWSFSFPNLLFVLIGQVYLAERCENHRNMKYRNTASSLKYEKMMRTIWFCVDGDEWWWKWWW